MAVKARVIRLQHLNRIDADHARSLYKQISARGWNKPEPEEVGNERAIWLQQAVSHRFTDAAVAEVVNRTGLHHTYSGAWINWEVGIRRDDNSVQLTIESSWYSAATIRHRNGAEL